MMHFAFASDNKFTLQLQTSVCSLLKASAGIPDVQNIHILDCGIEEGAWRGVEARILSFARRCSVQVEIARHAVDMSMFERFRTWNASRAAYARLLLPELLSGVRYCVYSDCDVLFFKNPWELVSQLKAAGVAILGHRNPSNRDGLNYDEKWFIEHGEPYSRDSYFCSGLVAMDLDKFRRPGAMEAMFDFLSRHADVVSADQTALNWYFRDDSALASDGWGVFPMECFGDRYEICAIHYVCGWPWKKVRTWYVHAMQGRQNDVWRRFARNVAGGNVSVGGCTIWAWLSSKAAGIVSRLVVALDLKPPFKKEYFEDFRDMVYHHDAFDRAVRRLFRPDGPSDGQGADRC